MRMLVNHFVFILKMSHDSSVPYICQVCAVMQRKGVFFRILSHHSLVASSPRVYFEPTSYQQLFIANASNESISLGRIPVSSKFAHAAPVSYTIFLRLKSSWTAGGDALPGSPRPIASEYGCHCICSKHSATRASAWTCGFFNIFEIINAYLS